MPDELGRVLQQARAEQHAWQQLFLATLQLSDDELRQALQSPRAEQRFAAALLVGEKRLPWQRELNPLLQDRSLAVRQAARRSLVVLSFLALNPAEAALLAAPVRTRPPTPLTRLKRPVDFGPAPAATAAGQWLAAEKWAAWWATQEKGITTDSSRGGSGAATTAPAVTDAGRLASAFVQAPPERQREMLARYRDAKGVAYTEAMAAAVPRLSGDVRHDLRHALAERLTRMTDQTLGRYLRDDDAEIRRAAALALTARKSRAHLGGLIDLLADPEPAVVLAAQAALHELTGEDFGPPLHATEAERVRALERWRGWLSQRPPDANR